MPFSGEEELDKLLRRQVIRQSRNFQKSRLFDIANSRQFLEKFRLPVHALIHLLELVGPCLEHRNDTQQICWTTQISTMSTKSWLSVMERNKKTERRSCCSTYSSVRIDTNYAQLKTAPVSISCKIKKLFFYSMTIIITLYCTKYTYT